MLSPKNSANAIFLSFALFLLLVVALSVKFSEGSLEGLAVGNSLSQTTIGGSAPLVLSDAILPGNNSIINYSNGVYGNVGNSSLFSFTLGILYNSNCSNQSNVVLNHYKNDATVQTILNLVAGEGNGLLDSGMASTTLETSEYVQLVFGASLGCSLEVLSGSSYSIIRISQ